MDIDVENLLEQRKIKLEFVEDSLDFFARIRDKEIITNDSSFTKGLLREAGIEHFYSVRDASLREAEELKEKVRGKEIVGLGGGRAIDIAKKVSFDLGLRLISVPTAPSHDGLVSRNCTLCNNNSKRESMPTKYPDQLIIPLRLWRNCGDLRKAGICDLLSNLIALQDLSLAESRNGGKFNNFYKELSFKASQAANFKTEKEFAYSLIISGIAMEENSCYCSGSEHEIEKLLEERMKGRYLHGQLVGTGALISAKVYSVYYKELPDLRFDGESFFADMKKKMEEEKVCQFALIPLKDKDFKPEFLKEVNKIRPERYSIWNAIDSENVDWEKIISQI